MKAGLSQSVRLGQELKINPRLYQAMDMLTMPLLDLQQHLKQELLVNPFLELIEDDSDDETGDADDETEESPTEGEAFEVPLEEAAPAPETDPRSQETDWEEILLDGFDVSGPREDREEREYTEPVSVSHGGLEDDLREQLDLLSLTPRQRVLADEFIGNINDDGYLACDLDEILRGINAEVERSAEATGRDSGPVPYFTPAEADEMLAIIQRLEPPGVGARDLRECLLLQLRELPGDHSLARRVLAEHFEELIAHRWAEIARRVGSTAAEVQHAADQIAKLNPKPGFTRSETPDGYVIPDLVVEKVDGQYLVFLNDTNIPRLRLSRVYQEMARDRKKFTPEHKEFIASKLNAAQWLVQAIEQRRQTMLKVMHFIVDRQRDFFEKGVQFLKPLTLREVADVIGMHESTVSRVTSDKYVQTPRGVLPLKFFFSSGIATAGGEDMSARGIKDKIDKLVKDEDPKDPLTDQAIVEMLEKEGIRIARRTVAKYREQLRVLPARMRKRV
ncbi:MAG: RNA polymerase factor sigma-54 [Gemmatimonadetes bacterium]|nr:RNA polymerase factor sigma-54 [Gemmatimonadota bacterium]